MKKTPKILMNDFEIEKEITESFLALLDNNNYLKKDCFSKDAFLNAIICRFVNWPNMGGGKKDASDENKITYLPISLNREFFEDWKIDENKLMGLALWKNWDGSANDAFKSFLQRHSVVTTSQRTLRHLYGDNVTKLRIKSLADDLFPYLLILFMQESESLSRPKWLSNAFKHYMIFFETNKAFSIKTCQRKRIVILDYIEQAMQGRDKISQMYFPSLQSEENGIEEFIASKFDPNEIIKEEDLYGGEEIYHDYIPYDNVTFDLKKYNTLEENELGPIIKAIDVKKNNGIRDKAIICLLAKTGISVSELCGLKVADVDFDNHKLLVNKGSDKKRTIVFDKTVKRALNNHLYVQRTKYPEQSDKPDCPLFISNKGLPISRITVFNLVKKYSRNAQIGKNVNPQNIRASVKRQLRAVKGDDKAKQVLGVKRFYKRDE